jgi:hypothetical protein
MIDKIAFENNNNISAISVCPRRNNRRGVPKLNGHHSPCTVHSRSGPLVRDHLILARTT